MITRKDAKKMKNIDRVKALCKADCEKAINELHEKGYSYLELYEDEDFGIYDIDNADQYVEELSSDAVFDILYGVLKDLMNNDYNENKMTSKEASQYERTVLLEYLGQLAANEGKFVKLYNMANSEESFDDLLIKEYPDVVREFYAD